MWLKRSWIAILLLLCSSASGSAIEPIGEPVELLPHASVLGFADNGRGLSVVAWQTYYDRIGLQRFQNGIPTGLPQELRTLNGTPLAADLVVDSGGAITISSTEQVCPECGVPPSGPEAHLYRLAPNGTFLEAPKRIPGATIRIDGGPDGRVASTGLTPVADGYTLTLTVRDRQGQEVVPATPVEVPPMHRAVYSDVAVNLGGINFVAWAEMPCLNSICGYGELYGRLFDAGGVPLTPVTLLAPSAVNVSVEALPDGRFLAAWTVPEDPAFNINTPMAIRARTVSEHGLGAVVPVIVPASGMTNGRSHSARPLLAVDARGDAVVIWREEASLVRGWKIFVQGLDPDRGAEGPRHLLEEWTDPYGAVRGFIRVASHGIAVGKPGEFFTVWLDPEEYRLLLQRFRRPLDPGAFGF